MWKTRPSQDSLVSLDSFLEHAVKQIQPPGYQFCSPRKALSKNRFREVSRYDKTQPNQESSNVFMHKSQSKMDQREAFSDKYKSLESVKLVLNNMEFESQFPILPSGRRSKTKTNVANLKSQHKSANKLKPKRQKSRDWDKGTLYDELIQDVKLTKKEARGKHNTAKKSLSDVSTKKTGSRAQMIKQFLDKWQGQLSDSSSIAIVSKPKVKNLKRKRRSEKSDITKSSSQSDASSESEYNLERKIRASDKEQNLYIARQKPSLSSASSSSKPQIKRKKIKRLQKSQMRIPRASRRAVAVQTCKTNVVHDSESTSYLSKLFQNSGKQLRSNIGHLTFLMASYLFYTKEV